MAVPQRNYLKSGLMWEMYWCAVHNSNDEKGGGDLEIFGNVNHHVFSSDRPVVPSCFPPQQSGFDQQQHETPCTPSPPPQKKAPQTPTKNGRIPKKENFQTHEDLVPTFDERCLQNTVGTDDDDDDDDDAKGDAPSVASTQIPAPNPPELFSELPSPRILLDESSHNTMFSYDGQVPCVDALVFESMTTSSTMELVFGSDHDDENPEASRAQETPTTPTPPPTPPRHAPPTPQTPTKIKQTPMKIKGIITRFAKNKKKPKRDNKFPPRQALMKARKLAAFSFYAGTKRSARYKIQKPTTHIYDITYADNPDTPDSVAIELTNGRYYVKTGGKTKEVKVTFQKTCDNLKTCATKQVHCFKVFNACANNNCGQVYQEPKTRGGKKRTWHNGNFFCEKCQENLGMGSAIPKDNNQILQKLHLAITSSPDSGGCFEKSLIGSSTLCFH